MVGSRDECCAGDEVGSFVGSGALRGVRVAVRGGSCKEVKLSVSVAVPTATSEYSWLSTTSEPLSGCTPNCV